MRLAESRRQSRRNLANVSLRGRQQEMNVIGRQAIGRADDPMRLRPLDEEDAIERVVAGFRKHRHSPVAARRDAMRNVGRHDAGKSGHDGEPVAERYSAMPIMSPK